MTARRTPRAPQYGEHASSLTPAMRSVIDSMARAGYPPMHTLSADDARAAYIKGANVLEVPRAELPRVEDFHIPARDGYQLPARLYGASPKGKDVLPTLLFFHGGGFTIGSIATHDILCRELCRLADCLVVSLDYRLAPQYQFPVAVNDCEDAMHWLADNGSDFGVNGNRMAVGGDSAGGTLAAVCALMARDTGIGLKLQMLFYPGTAAHADTPSHRKYAQGLILDEPSIAWFFDQYIPDHEQRDDWRFAPLNAPDLEGVAPAWLGLAELDPLFDEGMQYADHLRAAGVPVDLEIYRGVTHEFIKLGRAVPEARQAHLDAANALRNAFEN